MAKKKTTNKQVNANTWNAFQPFTSEEFAEHFRDQLVEGYCVPLNGKQFRIFVADEITGTQRGFFLKLMYEWGIDETVDIRDEALYPDVSKVFKNYLPKSWVNRGKTRHCYKYIMFGHGLANKHLALSLMHGIIASIAK